MYPDSSMDDDFCKITFLLKQNWIEKPFSRALFITIQNLRPIILTRETCFPIPNFLKNSLISVARVGHANSVREVKAPTKIHWIFYITFEESIIVSAFVERKYIRVKIINTILKKKNFYEYYLKKNTFQY